MLKISKKVSYIIVGVLTFISLLLGIFTHMELLLWLCGGGVSLLVYILYLFVPIKKILAYLHGLISSLIINAVCILPNYLGKDISQYNDILSYNLPVQHIIKVFVGLFVLEASLGGFLHLVNYCVHKLMSRITKKISPKISYIIVGIFVFIAFLFDYLLNKDKIGAGFYLLSTLIIMPVSIYIMYLFVDIEKKYAYLHAFISSIPVYLGSFWSFWPESIYYEKYYTEAVPDSYIDVAGIILVSFLLHLLFWGFVYLIANYSSKRKCRVKSI